MSATAQPAIVKSTDEQLIAAIAGRSEAALAELYRRESRCVHAFVMRMINDDDAAADVVNETFFEVWRKAAGFAGSSKVRTWMLGIARHKALDVLRARPAWTEQVEDWKVIEDTVESDEPSCTDLLIAGQDAAMLRECVAALPEAQRECIHLVFVAEMGLAEIAQLQGVPENTVKTRLFHARRKLKEMVSARIGASTLAAASAQRLAAAVARVV